MSKLLWECDTCGETDSEMPWECPTCHVETCNNCFDRFAHCRSCSEKLTKEQLIEAATREGFDFNKDIEPDE